MNNSFSRLLCITWTLAVIMLYPIIAFSDELITYKNNSHNFVIKYPKIWKLYSPREVEKKTNVLLSPSKNTVAIIANPNNYDQNVNIQVIEGVQELTLTDTQIRDIARRMDQSFPQQFELFVKISDRIILVDKHKALEYTFKALRKDIQIQQKQITIVKNGKVYIVTCTARDTEFKGLDDKYFQILINSIKL